MPDCCSPPSLLLCPVNITYCSYPSSSLLFIFIPFFPQFFFFPYFSPSDHLPAAHPRRGAAWRPSRLEDSLMPRFSDSKTPCTHRTWRIPRLGRTSCTTRPRRRRLATRTSTVRRGSGSSCSPSAPASRCCSSSGSRKSCCWMITD
jgi:hypothetical protein